MNNFGGFFVTVLQDDDIGKRYHLDGRNNEREILVPTAFVERFERDDSWRSGLIMRYAKTVKNKTSDRMYGCGSSKSGEIPEDEPFAITDYENVPRGHCKIRENEEYVYLAIMFNRGHGSENRLLAVPAKLWEKYSSDPKWCQDMSNKYAKLKLGKFPENDAPDEVFGFIPESEGDF